MSEIVVAAIDIGTTHTGWAYSSKEEFEKDPHKIGMKIWNSGSLMSFKGPSCVLIKPDGRTLDCFGYDAEYKYAELALQEMHKQWYFFQRFKTMLFNGIGIVRNLLLEDSSGKKLPAKKVLALAIQYLKNDACQCLEKRSALGVTHWVLTVPAISNVAKQFFREAAEDAGIPVQNLSIVSEPQAASAFCKFLPPEKCVGRDKISFADLRIGAKYIVLDAGGTSVKFTVHKILTKNKHREVFSSRIDCGSTNVDEAFEKFLEEICGKAVIFKLKDRFMDDYVDLFRTFEDCKRKNPIGKCTIRFPMALERLFTCTSKGNNLKECVKASSYQNFVAVVDNKLRIDSEVMRSFYAVAVTKIIRSVEALLKNPITSDCSAIVMVGGFSKASVLQESIQDKFSGLKVIIPEEADLAVVKGAVILGHDPLALDVEKTEVSMQSLMKSLDETRTGKTNYRMDRKPRVSMQSLMPSYNETRPDLPSYKMDRKPRGWCIIINVEKFHNNDTRTGTQHDKARLLEVFGFLNFIVVCYDNLTSTEIRKTLVDASNKNHSEFDCFVCCILSHGSLGHVYGSDNKAISIKEITSQFNAFRCDSLKGKPKLFFIQACQGEESMQGATSLETDSSREDIIPLDADFLYGYATVPGHVAYRNSRSGSWYMRALCDSLKELHKSHHLVDILIEVNRRVAKESAKEDGGIYKQIPAPQTTLRKRLYFR